VKTRTIRMQVNLNMLGRNVSNIGWKISNYNANGMTEVKGNDEQGLEKLGKAWTNVQCQW
jgi:hypothetical protein